MGFRKNILGWIPSFITSLGLISGALAIFFAIDGHLTFAGIFILIAAVFDFLDGFSARLLNAYSLLGKELDSLADLISFGLAPAAILFTLLEFALFGKNQPIHEIDALWYEWLALASAFLIPVFSALRLAKFNISTNQDRNFIGLPTPANAILWASLAIIVSIPGNTELIRLLFTVKNLAITAVVTSLLLVSRIPMFSLKFSSGRWKENWHRYIFIILCIGLAIFFHVYAVPALVLIYIFSNMVFYLLKIELA